MFRRLGKNADYILEGVSGWKGKEDLAQPQERAGLEAFSEIVPQLGE
jgi:hypothetical protein